MPPLLASLLTVGFIFFLFRRDAREKDRVSGALWIPVLWLLIIGSRPVSEWLNAGPPSHAAALEDGSPLDRLFFLALILAGLTVLVRRGVRFSTVFRENRWLILYLLYCLISILWSDFPLVALKRWIKALGHPIMVLIVLSESNRKVALTKVLNRCAYVLIPVSVLYIKYYPELGRGYDEWTGRAFYTGVTTNKNALGHLCMVFGFSFVWQVLKVWGAERNKARRNQLVLCGVFLAMIFWLLKLTDAKTALVTFLVSSALAVLLGTRLIAKKHVGTYIVVGALAIWLVESTFGVYKDVIVMLGRNPTLTDRTYVWKDVLAMENDPILGTGFESFWLGERLEKMWDKYWWRPNQAHNGYIETYINLGAMGILMLGAFVISSFVKIQRVLLRDPEIGRFRMPLMLAILLFNYTDAIFKALHPLWFVFYLIAMDYPEKSRKPVAVAAPLDQEDGEGRLCSAGSPT